MSKITEASRIIEIMSEAERRSYECSVSILDNRDENSAIAKSTKTQSVFQVYGTPVLTITVKSPPFGRMIDSLSFNAKNGEYLNCSLVPSTEGKISSKIKWTIKDESGKIIVEFYSLT